MLVMVSRKREKYEEIRRREEEEEAKR